MLYERVIGALGGDLRMTYQPTDAQYDPEQDPIAGLIEQLYEQGSLGAYVMTLKRVCKKFGVPFATANSWTKANPERGGIYLRTLEGLTEKERLVLVSDFVKCYRQWRPRSITETS